MRSMLGIQCPPPKKKKFFFSPVSTGMSKLKHFQHLSLYLGAMVFPVSAFPNLRSLKKPHVAVMWSFVFHSRSLASPFPNHGVVLSMRPGFTCKQVTPLKIWKSCTVNMNTLWNQVTFLQCTFISYHLEFTVFSRSFRFKSFLGGGFNQFAKFRQIGSFREVGVKHGEKKINWNRHLDFQNEPKNRTFDSSSRTGADVALPQSSINSESSRTVRHHFWQYPTKIHSCCFSK